MVEHTRSTRESSWGRVKNNTMAYSNRILKCTYGCTQHMASLCFRCSKHNKEWVQTHLSCELEWVSEWLRRTTNGNKDKREREGERVSRQPWEKFLFLFPCVKEKMQPLFGTTSRPHPVKLFPSLLTHFFPSHFFGWNRDGQNYLKFNSYPLKNYMQDATHGNITKIYVLYMYTSYKRSRDTSVSRQRTVEIPCFFIHCQFSW